MMTIKLCGDPEQSVIECCHSPQIPFLLPIHEVIPQFIRPEVRPRSSDSPLVQSETLQEVAVCIYTCIYVSGQEANNVNPDWTDLQADLDLQ
jgi:hypothetical protein